ncbi:amidinotransferase, partial [Gelidibacter salicanalis]|nr:amidinotransferase [Gelidibacter salicanalis]
AIQYIIDQVNPEKVIRPPEEVHIEGGDVMLWNDYIFVGTYREADYANYIVARTNMEGVAFLEKTFPHK